jgi:hypothetical protein
MLFSTFRQHCTNLNEILLELLQDIFIYYASEEIDLDLESSIPFVVDLFYQSKEIWSRNFGLFSKISFEN